MKLSIIIAVYNQEELIKRAIESIPEDCEIIVVDDGSTDRTVEVVKQYKQVKLIENGKNLGVGLTRNAGLDNATGEYVGFLDSDDYFYTDKIKEVMEHLDGINDVVFYNMKLNNGTIINLTISGFRNNCGMNKFMRREFIKDLRFPDRQHGEDWIFTKDLANLKGKIKFTGILAYHYNYPRENSLCWLYEKGMLKDRPRNIKVKATGIWQKIGLSDREYNKVWKRGEVFFIDEERYNELINENKWGEPLIRLASEDKDYKFSVVIPNRNNEQWLEKCIGSVLKQTYKNYEIMFVDDMSEDNSVEVAKKLIGNQGKVIELEQRRLNGGSRNVGILEASGDYIVFLDSDDWLADENVLKDFNSELNGEEVMFVNLTQSWKGLESTSWKSNYKNKYEAMASKHGGACMKVIRTDFAKKHLFNEGTLMEDRNHHSRICYYMKDWIYYDRYAIVHNRDNPNSVTTTRDKIWWGTSKWRNLADAKMLLEEVKLGNEIEAIRVMETRIEEIERRINTDEQN